MNTRWHTNINNSNNNAESSESKFLFDFFWLLFDFVFVSTLYVPMFLTTLAIKSNLFLVVAQRAKNFLYPKLSVCLSVCALAIYYRKRIYILIIVVVSCEIVSTERIQNHSHPNRGSRSRGNFESNRLFAFYSVLIIHFSPSSSLLSYVLVDYVFVVGSLFFYCS